MNDRLYIAARAPRPGFTKTRLGRVICHEVAARLYAAFLRDLSARFASAAFETGWYVTPPDAWPEILPCLRGVSPTPVVIPQPTGDWAARQRALFTGMERRGEGRTVLIASDSPHLSTNVITHAFDQLRDRDLVFGPVLDGGYYLIGMRSSRAAVVLDGVAMSNGDVLHCLIESAGALGLSMGLVETTFDIDKVEDLERLHREVLRRHDLSATREALSRMDLRLAARPVSSLTLSGIEGNR